MNPLTEKNALFEADLLDIRLNILESRVGLLFDLRTALNLRSENTGLLIGRGIHHLEWINDDERIRKRSSHMTMTSIPKVQNNRVEMLIQVFLNAELRVQTNRVEFYTGRVPDIGDEQQPDFGMDDDATIRARMQTWESEFHPRTATFLDPQA